MSAGSLAEEPPAGYPSREQRQAAALLIIRWLVQLGQAPALRGVICQELQSQALPSAAINAAAALVATPGLPREAAAVARMLQQQREVLLGSLGTVLPMPGSQSAIYESRRPLPFLGDEAGYYSLLYWQLSTLLLLDGRLVEVSAQRGASCAMVPVSCCLQGQAGTAGKLRLVCWPSFPAGKRPSLIQVLCCSPHLADCRSWPRFRSCCCTARPSRRCLANRCWPSTHTSAVRRWAGRAGRLLLLAVRKSVLLS